MLSLDDGRSIAKIVKKKKNEVIFIDENEKGYNKIVVNGSEHLEPMPNVDGRDVIYIAGPSGSGKSTYASEYMTNFKKIFPQANIFVFSRVTQDEKIDKLLPYRIAIDTNLINNPIDIFAELQEGDLVLFDDCDTIQDKKIRDAVSKVQNDILETGRHKNIYILVTSHLINGNDRKNTRTILNEAHSITIFPKSGSKYQIEYMLKNYIGLSKKQITDILQIDSRWITIGKSYPQYVMWRRGVCLI